MGKTLVCSFTPGKGLVCESQTARQVTLPPSSGVSMKTLMRWYLEYHRDGMSFDSHWGTTKLPATPAMLHVEVDSQQVSMSLFKTGVVYRYEGYGAKFVAFFKTDIRQPFVDFLKLIATKDKARGMLIINGKDIDSTVGNIMRRHSINQSRRQFDSIRGIYLGKEIVCIYDNVWSINKFARCAYACRCLCHSHK